MNVLFLPDWSRGNPYQRELANALKIYGVYVSMSNGVRWLPLLGTIRTHGKPDILHLHWTYPFLFGENSIETIFLSFRFLVELIFVKLLGIKICWTVHNLFSHKRQTIQLEKFFNYVFARFCDQLIVHCPFAREALMKAYRLSNYFNNKINVIPHGNYIGSYKNEVNQEDARSELGLCKDEIIFLYFGLIRFYKGVYRLIEEFQKLKCTRARLLIVGKPINNTIKAELMRICGQDSRISTYLQFTSNEEIQLYMNAADIVVLPYRDILTSGTSILAISFGKPVIAPAIGCIPDVLDSIGSVLYNPSEEESLLKAMEKTLELKTNLTKMGKHNFELAKQLRWEDIANRTYGVYKECLKRR